MSLQMFDVITFTHVLLMYDCVLTNIRLKKEEYFQLNMSTYFNRVINLGCLKHLHVRICPENLWLHFKYFVNSFQSHFLHMMNLVSNYWGHFRDRWLFNL